jgi:Uncharacterized protein conserved in bacteria
MVMSKILDLFRRTEKVKHIMEDEFFGTLTWDEDHQMGWRGIMTLANGKTSAFMIDGAKTDESVPEAVRNTAKFLIANEPLIRDKIAASMSGIYNGTWSGGDTITPEEMAQRITLTDVSFYEEGGGELYYQAADELFTDHTICASLEANGEIGEPELEG